MTCAYFEKKRAYFASFAGNGTEMHSGRRRIAHVAWKAFEQFSYRWTC